MSHDVQVGPAADGTPSALGLLLADPSLLVAQGRYWLYPTTDGHPGTAIDPSVFTDDDGVTYLYWGNAVPLNDDLMSFDPAKVVSWVPTAFREAATVHRRHDRYYLSWSENDTREPDYRVRYAVGPGPLGPWEDRGVLLAKDTERGILGTGHHAVLRVPGTDDWIVAYHRFAIPDGDGTHREIMFDRLVHRPDGDLEPVTFARTPIRVPLPPTALLGRLMLGRSAAVFAAAVLAPAGCGSGGGKTVLSQRHIVNGLPPRQCQGLRP
ncbi:family 43 glycosylhydrolase [Nonomuraea sp. NPDC050451]|uniref:family 43 glycosylhydrolase n=1 Tax=Nonomuraea sp. NPDC050451 TaxID=3364364 RepID=UPI0037A43C71